VATPRLPSRFSTKFATIRVAELIPRYPAGAPAMPAAYLMSWEPTRRRWWKMAGGRRRVVSVRQLRKYFDEPSIPETKEGSRPWANRWWEEQEQPPASAPAPDPFAVVLDGHVVDDPHLARFIVASSLADAGRPLPDGLAEAILGRPRVEELRRVTGALLDRAEAPAGRTLGHQAGRYLAMLHSRHRAGEISVGEYANAHAGLAHFRDWAGADRPVESITAERWQGYYLHLIGEDGPRSVESRRKFFRYARNFLTWMADLGVQSAPPNLNRRQYRFKGGPMSVPVTPTEVIKDVIRAAKGQLKLHILLMLNCGFTQQDVSELRPGEVDWSLGRIRRKRSKTGDHDKVPFVDYRLWPEAFALLRRYRVADPDRVLLTGSGRPWVRDGVDAEGVRSRTDAIQSCYRHLRVAGKPPLKMMRKASSTMLDGSPEHGRYAVHFLGHAPDVAHRHYINSNGAGFDAAVAWLGEQFGCPGRPRS